MRRGRGGRPDRRLAAAVLALAGVAGVAGVLAAVGFSCTAATGPAGPDYTIPRDLEGAPAVRVAIGRGVAKALIEVRGPYRIFADLAPGARPIFAGEGLPPVELSLEAAAAAGGREGPGIILGTTVFCPGLVRVEPERSGTLLVNGTAYRGDLVARTLAGGKGLLLVNRVNLEEYVAGVLGSEMPLGFPEAALRAQAIASRTYGLHEARGRGGELYDVADDQSSQVYKGLTNETDLARRVTLDTLGVILTYRGKVLKAYFHSTCGGETISAAWVFGEREIPPLGGGPCGFCEDSKYFRWRHVLERGALLEKLAGEGFPVRSIARIEVAERGPGGHVATVRIVHPEGEVRIAAAKLRALIGTSAIRSTAFEIEDGGPGGPITFAGRGFGHGAGMCQVGARGMARAGYDAITILRRYYPAADLVRIYSTPGSVRPERPKKGTE